jgi:hypothetical protein
MEAARFSETSVNYYRSTRHHISEEETSNSTLNIFIVSDIVRILWHVDPFLGNGGERSWCKTAVAK